jgi:hypothetical protein
MALAPWLTQPADGHRMAIRDQDAPSPTLFGAEGRFERPSRA